MAPPPLVDVRCPDSRSLSGGLLTVTVAASITFGRREEGERKAIILRRGPVARGSRHPATATPASCCRGRPGVTGHIKAPEEEAFPGPGGHGPSMWIVVSALSLVPLLVGSLTDSHLSIQHPRAVIACHGEELEDAEDISWTEHLAD